MTESRSDYIVVRGLRYHIRRWGDAQAPALFLLHGWLDASETFEPVARQLVPGLQVIAPDWRGFGLSEWTREGYWFPDYLADLEAILDHYSPDAPALIAGHSMGAQVVSQYAGLRPDRVARLACLDGPFLPELPPEYALRRHRQWLDQVRSPMPKQRYASHEQFSLRLRKLHPQLSPELALRVARSWAREAPDGGVEVVSDPRHRWVFPLLYRIAESMVMWREITAPVLFIDGGRSEIRLRLDPAELAERRSCFRDHQVRLVESAGHMLHFDAPEETGRHLAEFFTA